MIKFQHILSNIINILSVFIKFDCKYIFPAERNKVRTDNLVSPIIYKKYTLFYGLIK